MPTIVDALVVQLGLDATDFKKGQREVADQWKKTKDISVKHAGEVEEANKKLLGSFEKLTKEVAGFFGAIAAADGFKEFIKNVTDANSAVGRFADNIGESPQMLQAWGLALERVGGKTEDASASIASLSKAFFALKYQGKALPPEIYRIFAMTNRTVDTSKGLDYFLNQTAGALKEISKTDRSAAFFFGQGMGLSPSMVTLMTQYGDATTKFVNSLKGLTATDAQIKSSEELLEKWNQGLQVAGHIAQTIASWVTPELIHFFDDLDKSLAKVDKTLERATPYFTWLNSEFNKGANALNRLTGQPEVPTDATPGATSGGGWWDWLWGGGAKASGRRGSNTGRVPDNVGAGPAGGAGGSSSANATEAYNAARAAGLSDVAARALVANMAGESLARPGDYHWDRRHFSQGIVQWDPERAEAIKQQFGKYPKDMTVSEQTQAAIWEMQNNPAYSSTWQSLQGSDPADMIDKLVRNYENPADKEGAIATRMRNFQGLNVNGASAQGGDGPVVFGDSIAAGLKDYGHAQGAAVVGMGSSWITRQIQNYGSSLKGRKIVLSSGASNSRDPDALAGEIMALIRRGVDPKNITVLGVGDLPFMVNGNFNDKLKQIAERAGANFQPIFPGKDHIHPGSYQKLWNGIPGLSNLPAGGVPLSHLQTVHPVTTSSSSNAMNINGGVHVNAPQATDANGIASSVADALSRYGFAMMAQSGQV